MTFGKCLPLILRPKQNIANGTVKHIGHLIGLCEKDYLTLEHRLMTLTHGSSRTRFGSKNDTGFKTCWHRIT
jgi:hypothetical protein